MKKLKEMKKNNKGFSLVELIVVIAIMVVLVAVLGSTILGYIDKSKHSKDITALDAVDTAVGLMVADPNSDYSAAADEDGCTLKTLMEVKKEGKNVNQVLADTLAEVFNASGKFQNSSSAFEGITTNDVWVKIDNGAVTITVKSKDTDYANYQSPSGSTELAAPGDYTK